MGILRVASEHGSQSHSRTNVPHEVDCIQLFQPCPIVKQMLLPTNMLRVLVFDTKTLDSRPQPTQLTIYTLFIHTLRILGHA